MRLRTQSGGGCRRSGGNDDDAVEAAMMMKMVMTTLMTTVMTTLMTTTMIPDARQHGQQDRTLPFEEAAMLHCQRSSSLEEKSARVCVSAGCDEGLVGRGEEVADD
jgi:hypothetical protein